MLGEAKTRTNVKERHRGFPGETSLPLSMAAVHKPPGLHWRTIVDLSMRPIMTRRDNSRCWLCRAQSLCASGQ